VDIAKLETHMGYLKNGLYALAVLCAAFATWSFYNIYQPIQAIAKDSAVQGVILNEIKDDLKDMNGKLDGRHDQSQKSPR